jgi:hypothetical protein
MREAVYEEFSVCSGIFLVSSAQLATLPIFYNDNDVMRVNDAICWAWLG